MRISDWSSDVCSSDLHAGAAGQQLPEQVLAGGTQSIEDVAGLFEALLDAGFVQQLQNGTLGGSHPQIPGQARRRGQRSEARRVGKEGDSTFRSRWSTCH